MTTPTLFGAPIGQAHDALDRFYTPDALADIIITGVASRTPDPRVILEPSVGGGVRVARGCARRAGRRVPAQVAVKYFGRPLAGRMPTAYSVSMKGGDDAAPRGESVMRYSESTVSGYVQTLEAHFGCRLGTSALEGGLLLLDGAEEVAAGDLAALRGGRRAGAREARRDIAAGCWNHLAAQAAR